VVPPDIRSVTTPWAMSAVDDVVTKEAFMLNKVLTMVSRAHAARGARRAAAGMVLAAAPLLYAVPAGAAQYTAAWMATFGNQYGQLAVQAGMSLSCYFIPLAVPVCVPLMAA
jgi:hypothetical protein